MTANLNGPDVSRDAMRDALTGSGLTPHFEWLRADTLKSPAYQRPLRPAWARAIARNLDPDKFWPLIVSRREDGDYVLDGQHRLVAVRDILNWQDQNVPCEVYEGLTPQTEAKLFATQSARSRKFITAMEQLHADIHAGLPEAIGVHLTVRRAGLEIPNTSASEGRGIVRAADALRKIYRTYGPARLQELLTLLRDTFGDDSDVFKVDMLNGASAFLMRYADDPNYERAEFIRKLAPIGVTAVMQRATAIQAGLMHNLRGGSGAHVGRALMVLYNSGKRSKQLAEWQDRPTLPEQAAADKNERISATLRRQFAQGLRPLTGRAAQSVEQADVAD